MTIKRALYGEAEVLTADEVAEILRVSRRKINQLVAAGEIPFVRIEGRSVSCDERSMRNLQEKLAYRMFDFCANPE